MRTRSLRRLPWLGLLLLLLAGGVWRWRAGRASAPGELHRSIALPRSVPAVKGVLPLATSPIHLVSAVAEYTAGAGYGIIEGHVQTSRFISTINSAIVPKGHEESSSGTRGGRGDV